MRVADLAAIPDAVADYLSAQNLPNPSCSVNTVPKLPALIA